MPKRKLLREIASASSTTPEAIEDILVDNLTGGINTTLDPKKLQDNEFTSIVNYDLRNTDIIARGGFTEFSLVSNPNANKVLGFYALKRYTGLTDYLRFTRNSIHKYSGGAWVAITGVALTGSDNDNWTCFIVEDRIFASNGVQNLFEINLAANTYAFAGNARTYKYYTVANRRIIGANLVSGSPVPIEIATCGNRNYAEWNPLVDISAYQNPMVDAETLTLDEITGVVALKDNIIVFREKSIWLGEPQPIASTPFNFRKVVSSIGCTCPGSIQKCGDNTILFYDPATTDIYYFKLNVNGVDLKPIGKAINIEISTLDPNYFRSTFNPNDNEYELYHVTPSSSYLTVYKYGLDVNAWWKHSIAGASFISYEYVPTVTGTIASLGSTPISSLSGTIAGLSNTINSNALRVIGTWTGYIGQESNYYGYDLYTSISYELISKRYSIPYKNQTILSIGFDIEYEAPSWTVAILARKNFYSGFSIGFPNKVSTNVYDYIVFKQNHFCSGFQWKFVIATAYPGMRIRSYNLKRVPAGDL